ncbi:pre-mRNA-splicing factor Bud31p [[Candida] anglica]|uniref:Pre-mRNA-splicing factor Bud31p n=1 Tax=[Candida] anglica TaxID=148631 RepID=A0ABP0ELZ4_9ASCO
MPPVKSSRRSKTPPEGFKTIEPTLIKLQNKLKEAQSKSIKAEDKHNSLWPILQINHQISRYIYTLYYQKEAISKDLYEWLLSQKYGDAILIAKWKKTGYESLCCIQCIMKKDKNHGNTCICRVPKSTLMKNKQDEKVECITCGCKGCASSD